MSVDRILLGVFIGSYIAGMFQIIWGWPVLGIAVGGLLVVLYMGHRLAEGQEQLRYESGSMGYLLTLTPDEFEQAVADLLKRLGYRRVKWVGGPGDLAVDILCQDKEGQKIAVQCKRHAPGTKIRSPDLQKFIGMAFFHHHADAGIFVTTADFTDEAAELANEHNVWPMDGGELAGLFSRTMINAGTDNIRFCPFCGARREGQVILCPDCGQSFDRAGNRGFRTLWSNLSVWFSATKERWLGT